jgi:hypothetical protein
LQEKSAITRTVDAAPGVYAPGHLGELTQIVDHDLVDAVLEETGARQERLRLLPSRVVVYFILALALFESCSYLAVWGKLTCALGALAGRVPAASSLARARRRVGVAPLRRLFEVLSGPVAVPGQAGAFYRGLRAVVIDGTHLHAPDLAEITWRYPKRAQGLEREFGYPLLRLLAVVECGTRALVGACFGPDTEGELGYARRLLGCLDHSMLLLADAGFDATEFLREVQQSGARFLVRSSARRRCTIAQRLPDGSYLTRIVASRYRPGAGWCPLQARVIEAWITVTLQDGTVQREQWRLITNLLDHTRYPAAELVDLYHQRWQVETAYYSLKATLLDGRVLRSRSIPGLDQEVYAVMASYQALIRASCEVLTHQPDTAPARVSFTVLLEAARDQVVLAANIHPATTPEPLGAIARAVLATLHPPHRRQRVKARSRKNPTTKYRSNASRHPQTTQHYTITTEIQILKEGLAPRPPR